MNVEFRTVGDVVVARILEGRIDAHATGELKAKVGHHIDGGTHRIVLDLSTVELVDSTGLGGMLSLLKRLPRAGNLVLCGCRPAVVELLKLTRLDRVFPIAGNEAQALALFGS